MAWVYLECLDEGSCKYNDKNLWYIKGGKFFICRATNSVSISTLLQSVTVVQKHEYLKRNLEGYIL
jgi:hypothetical protein